VNWKHSITVRLSFAFALLAMLVLSALGIYLGRAADRHMAELDAHELMGKIALARQMARREASAGAFAERMADVLVGEHGIVVAVDTARGAIFAWPDPDLAAEIARSATAAGETPQHLHLGQREFRAVAGALDAAWGDGARVVVARDIHHHTAFLDGLRRDFWIAVTAALLLMVGVGILVARRGMRPVRDIALAAARISVGQLAERIPERDVPPELAAMVGAFNGMLARLEDSFARLSAFSADLAHELRTPIHSLRMQAEVSLGKERTPAEYRDLLANNLEEYERLSRIIADMLFLAKADHGLIVPQAEAVALLALCGRLAEYYGLLAENIDLRVEGDEAVVRGDRLMLERAIGNVLANAIKHTPESGTISLRVSRFGGVTQVAIANTGQPIPPEAVQRVFERFVRLDPQSEGSGLGLAIARSILRAHGGDITVETGKEVTVFCLNLPDENGAARTAD
jgi:two-component system heavy metal sensor histidine kinase CusS